MYVPGGKVVNASSEENRLCTNGMSEFARNEENSNAALLVGITPADYQSENPLAGMYFQRELEHKAFVAEEKTLMLGSACMRLY